MRVNMPIAHAIAHFSAPNAEVPGHVPVEDLREYPRSPSHSPLLTKVERTVTQDVKIDNTGYETKN